MVSVKENFFMINTLFLMIILVIQGVEASCKLIIVIVRGEHQIHQFVELSIENVEYRMM